VPTFVELGWLNAAAPPALEQLHAQLVAMSGERNAELWHVDALVHEEWDRIRSLATKPTEPTEPGFRRSARLHRFGAFR
jgi:hypothetical protein